MTITFIGLGAIILGFLIFFFASMRDVDERPDYTGKYTRPTAATNNVQNSR